MTTPTPESPDHGITAAMVSAATGGQIPADMPGLTGTIEGVVASVRRWCRWHIWPERSESVTLDGPGTRVAQLPSLRVAAVSSVALDGSAIDESDYTWSHRGWLTRRSGVWPEDDRCLQVAFRHGYENAPDVRRIIVAAVARMVTNPASRSSYRVGERQESWSPDGMSGFFGHELTELSLYRLPSVD